MNKLYLVLVIILLGLQINVFAQDDGGVSIGKGDADADPSAILELVSGNKGLLIPRLSSGEREGIGSPAAGLMVYDTTFSSFYYWTGGAWKPVNGIKFSSGTSFPGTAKEGDLFFNTDDSALHIYVSDNWEAVGSKKQILELTETTLSLLEEGKTEGSEVDLSVLFQDLSLQGTKLSISDGNEVDLGEIITGDQQTLTLDGSVLTISNGNNVDFASLLDEKTASQISVEPGGDLTSTDVQSALQELQTEITEGGGGDMMKSSYDTDENSKVDDADKVNGFTVGTNVPGTAVFTDNQNLFVSGNNLTISGGNTVTLPVSSGGTDDQTAAEVPVTPNAGIGLSGNNVQAALEELQSEITTAAGGGLTAVSHDASLTGSGTAANQLGIADNGVGLTKIADGGASQILTTDGSGNPQWQDISAVQGTGTDDQNLVLSGNNLSIESGNSVDLSPYLDNTDSQSLSNVLGNGNDAGGSTITNLGVPVTSTDAVTKNYVDNGLSGVEKQVNKNTANGYVGLGSDTKIDQAYLPGMVLNSTYTVANEAAQLALGVNKGDVAVRTDENKTYINTTGSNTSLAADWTELLTSSGGVSSVNTSTGDVVLDLDAVLSQGADAGGKVITNLSNPSNAQDAATKNYVDTQLGSLTDADDQTASEVANTAAGNIAATNVQAAINELDTEKLSTTAGFGGDVSGTYNNLQIGANAVTTTEIAAGAVTNAKLDKSNIPLSGFGNAGSDISVGNGTTNYKITNVLDPTSNQDVATKKYVDDNIALAGGGDMLKSVYDMSGTDGIVDVAETVSDNAITSAKISDGTVTNDDISATAAIAGSKIANTAAGNISSTNVQAAINELDAEKLGANTAITAGTNTKITYDANGLVTAGAQASGADIANTAAGNISSTDVQSAINELDTEKLAATLTSGNILVGNGSNVAGGVALSGAASLSNTGVLTLLDDTVTSANIKNGTILSEDLSQMGATDGQVLKWNGTSTAWEASAESSTTVEDLLTSTSTVNALSANQGLVLNGLKLDTTLASGNLFVGNGYNKAAGVALSGAASLSNTGVLTLLDDTVTSANIKDGTIVTADIANNAITTEKIGSGAVKTANLNSGSVTSDKIFNGTILSEDLSQMGATDGQVLKWNGTSTAWEASAESSTTVEDLLTSTSTVNALSANQGLVLNGLKLDTTLASGNLFVGNGYNKAVGVALSGAASLSNTGVLTLLDDTVTSANIKNGTILSEDLSQMGATDGQVLKWNGTSTAWEASAASSTTVEDLLTSTSTVNALSANQGRVLNGLKLDTTLTSGNLFVGNGYNKAVGVALSGAASLSNTGVLTLLDDTVTSANIKNGTILSEDLSQMGATDGQVLKWNGTSTAWEASAASSTTVEDLLTSTSTVNALSANQGLVLNGLKLDTTLASGNLFVGNGYNKAVGVALSGAASLSNTGVLTLLDDTVTSANIKDGTIVTADIANNAITTEKIGSSAVKTANLNAGSVISEKIYNGTILAEDLNQMGATDGQVLKWNGTSTAWEASAESSTTVEDLLTSTNTVNALSANQGRVLNGLKLDTTLTSGNLFVGNGYNKAVGVALSGAASLSNTGVLTLLDDTVTSTNIKDGTIVAADIANDAITNEKIGGGAVRTTHIFDGSVTSDKIFDGTIAALDLAANAVETAKIKDANVTTAKIADSNVTMSKLESGVGTSGKVLSSNGTSLVWTDALSTTLTDGKLLVGNGSNVAASVAMSGDVTMDNAGATTIGTGKVVTGMIADGTIAALDLAANAVETAKIKDANVTTAKIADSNVTMSKLESGVGTSGKVLSSNGTSLVWVDALSTTLTDGKLLVGNGSNVAASVAMSGDVTMSNLGVTTIGTGKVLNGMIAAGAVRTSNIYTGSVTSDKIFDGTIANADIAAAAAIAGTKINPDFGSQDVATTGNMQAGTPTVDHITVNGGDLTVSGDAEIDGDLWVDGTLNTPSDERLKKNITTLTGVLARLNSLRGVRYEYKDQQRYAAGPQVGVIAQELQQVFPELVSRGADGYLAVNYSQLTAVLLQAVKEQQQEIETLQKQMQRVMKKLGME